MIRRLNDEEHEKLWRICDGLLARSGARAALLCDAATGAPLISVGDTSAQGEPGEIRILGRRERLVRGPAGQMYGLEIPGGALLAVLHEDGSLDKVRKEAAKAARTAGAILHRTPAGKKKRSTSSAHREDAKKELSPRLRRPARRRSTRT
jgi:hypothetical protein